MKHLEGNAKPVRDILLGLIFAAAMLALFILPFAHYQNVSKEIKSGKITGVKK